MESEKNILQLICNYTSVNQTKNLSDDLQLKLRIWYKKGLKLNTGWIGYWVRCASYNGIFFNNNIDKIVKYSSYKELIIILNILCRDFNIYCKEQINEILKFIMLKLQDIILNKTENYELLFYIPKDGKKYYFAYWECIKYFKQSPKEFRTMINDLKVDKKLIIKNETINHTFWFSNVMRCYNSKNNIIVEWVYKKENLTMSFINNKLLLIGNCKHLFNFINYCNVVFDIDFQDEKFILSSLNSYFLELF